MTPCGSVPVPDRRSVIGRPVEDLDTPALLLDESAMDANIEKMAALTAAAGVGLRPHAKVHRAIPQIATRQLDAGAIGLTCAKLSEAEALVGVAAPSILIANQIVGPRKIDRLVRLAVDVDVIVAVDDPVNIAELSRAAQARGVEVGVLLELDIGHHRCGVAPYEPSLGLAEEIAGRTGLRLRGVMGYDGHCTTRLVGDERAVASRRANALLVDAAEYLRRAGLPIDIVSGAGTFTYPYALETPGITEIQAGTYALMDTGFRDLGVSGFDLALSVLTTVISRPTYREAGGMVIVDTGRKSMATALGMPQPRVRGASTIGLSDEHGRIGYDSPDVRPQIGETVTFDVADVNGTINQFDRVHVIRDGCVADVWPVPTLGNST